MANYNGLVTVDISSYPAFRAATIGNGYNVDGLYGYQCVDMPKLLTGNAGRSYPYWKSDPDGYAYEGWTVLSNRTYNAGSLFTLVANKADVRAGDIVVLRNTSSNPYGHIAFANTNWTASTTSAVLLGQNQENPSAEVGYKTTLTEIDVTTFLGAFRFNAWNTSPTPSFRVGKGKFPWVLYARKLRNKH